MPIKNPPYKKGVFLYQYIRARALRIFGTDLALLGTNIKTGKHL